MGPCKKDDKAARPLNVTSLCSAAVAKFRNQRMSAYMQVRQEAKGNPHGIPEGRLTVLVLNK